MNETDSPLKALVHVFIQDIAKWLLDKEILFVQPLPTNAPAGTFFSDTLFEVTLADKRSGILHIEFQGLSSQPSLPLRQLADLSHIVGVRSSKQFMESFILYIEKNSGIADIGEYSFQRMDGQPALVLRYTPIRLWQMSADSLLALEQPGITPLAGLMQTADQQKMAQKIMAIIHGVADEAQRRFIFSSVLTLMTHEECLQMLKEQPENDGLLLDTPFLREIRQKAFQEGVKQGLERGMEQGVQKGIDQGFRQGIEYGVQKGIDQGIQKGITLGREEVLIDGLLETIEFGLNLKYDDAGLHLMPRIHKIKDVGLLRSISDGIKSSSRIEEIESLIPE